LQETDRFQIHWAPFTVTKAFRTGGSRNDWVYVQTGGEANYGDLRGRVVAQLLALFNIRNILCEAAAVLCLALVRILDLINGGRFHIPNGHMRVANQINGRDMRIEHQQKTKVTPARTLYCLCVRRSRRIERKLGSWVCALLGGACRQGSLPPGRTRQNEGLRRYQIEKWSPDAT